MISTPCTAAPELWFSEAPDDVKAAKAGCAACPIGKRTQCLAEGVADDDRARKADLPITFSVWGGLTPRQRCSLSQEKHREKRTLFTWTAEASTFLTFSVMAGTPYAEIASELGTSEMSVRKRVGFERSRGQL